MVKPTCSVDDCQRETKGLGYCNPHYQRHIKYGDPLGSKPRPTSLGRFWSRVEKTATCWNWTGLKTDEGYGAFYIRRTHLQAHRYAWELVNGPIPEGAVIDHRCLNEGCVNPDHLRPSTIKQNNENRRGAMRHSRTGVRGVTWREDMGKFVANVRHHKVRYYLGTFATLAEADVAAIAKRNELFTHNELDRV